MYNWLNLKLMNLVELHCGAQVLKWNFVTTIWNELHSFCESRVETDHLLGWQHSLLWMGCIHCTFCSLYVIFVLFILYVMLSAYVYLVSVVIEEDNGKIKKLLKNIFVVKTLPVFSFQTVLLVGDLSVLLLFHWDSKHW